MEKIKTNKNSSFSFRKDILYPACVIFCILVFVYFLMALAAGVNVLESETVRTQIYDGEEDNSSFESSEIAPSALPVQTLFGLFMFAVSIMALGLLFKLNLSRIYINMLHFGGVLVSFFIFVLSLSGYISDGGLPMALVSCLFVSLIYFAIRGIIYLCRCAARGLGLDTNKTFSLFMSYLPKIFAVFTLIVFALSFFALITQFNVIVKLKEDKTFIYDDVLQTVFVTVVTPLAPTLQNYLRYLASAAVYIAAYAVLFTKLNKVLKVILNFLILAAGFFGIWIFGLDYFRLVSSNALPAIIIFLSVYAVSLISVCIYKYVKARKTEITADYSKQFK